MLSKQAAAPLTFEQWRRRPVFVAQCKTWRKAAELNLCGFSVRALPGYRNAYTQAARDLIAMAVRADRLRARLHSGARVAA